MVDFILSKTLTINGIEYKKGARINISKELSDVYISLGYGQIANEKDIKKIDGG